MNKEKEFVILVNDRITFIEDVKFIKNFKTVNKRVFVTFTDDTEEDFHFHEIKIREQKMKNEKYYYYACGENVATVKFNNSDDAWDYVNSNNGYDCVVESRY